MTDEKNTKKAHKRRNIIFSVPRTSMLPDVSPPDWFCPGTSNHPSMILGHEMGCGNTPHQDTHGATLLQRHRGCLVFLLRLTPCHTVHKNITTRETIMSNKNLTTGAHIEQTPLLCEECLSLYEPTATECSRCPDEPLLDISSEDVREMLRGLDQQRFHQAARRFMAVAIFISLAGHLTVFLFGWLLVGGKMMWLFGFNLTAALIMGSIAFFSLLGELILLKMYPPKTISRVWGEAGLKMRISTEQLKNGMTEQGL